MEDKSVRELQELAKSYGLKGISKLNKADLVTVIKDHKKKKHEKYVDESAIGLLAAFMITDTKAISGIIRELRAGTVEIETKSGRKFNVKKEDVVWVKTGERWPKHIYNLLKANINRTE